MTVAELIEELKKLPQDVIVLSEGEAPGEWAGYYPVTNAWLCRVISGHPEAPSGGYIHEQADLALPSIEAVIL